MKMVSSFNAKIKMLINRQFVVILNLTVMTTLIACTHANQVEGGIEVIKINDLQIENDYSLSDLIEVSKVIPLETRDSCLIGVITKVLGFQNQYYILDSRSAKGLFIFNDQGRFIRRIGKIGKGPGEYIIPDDFSIDEEAKQVYILNRRAGNVLQYSLNGIFIDEFQIDFSALNLEVANDCIAFAALDNYELFVTDKHGKTLYSKFPNEYYLPILGPLSKSNNKILFAHFMCDTIFSVDRDCVKPRYFIDFEDNKLTKKEYDRLKITLKNGFSQRIIEEKYMQDVFWLGQVSEVFRFSFNYDGTGTVNLYKGNTKSLFSMKSNRIKDDLFYGAFIQAPYVDRDISFIGYVDPHRIPDNKTILIENKVLVYDKMDNPILVIYDYK